MRQIAKEEEGQEVQRLDETGVAEEEILVVGHTGQVERLVGHQAQDEQHPNDNIRPFTI